MSRPLALITGGTSGIGFAAAEALLPTHDLALGFRQNESRARAARDRLLSVLPAAQIRIFPAELLGLQSSKELFSTVVAECGLAPEILIHSAGRLRKDFFLVAAFSEIEAMLNEHLVSAMALSQLALPGMYKQHHGKIIFIGSRAAKTPAPGQASYAAAKAGLEGFTKGLSLEVSHRGITVNCIAPGLIKTPLTEDFIAEQIDRGEKGGFGLPHEIGLLIHYLCIGEGRKLTGQVFEENDIKNYSAFPKRNP